MIRETSLEAYRTIKDNGLLSKRRLEVYDILFRFGPLTAQGVYEILVRENHLGTFRNQFNVTSRMSELVKLGVAKEIDRVKCKRSGMEVMRWDTTSKLPGKMPKVDKIKCPTCKGKGHIEQGRLL